MPSRPPLSRDRIVAAATELAEREGVDAVTMRRLGEALSVVPMALYRHFPNKEALLDAVVDAAAETLDTDLDGGTWREQLRELMTRLHRQLAARPAFVAMRVSRPMLSPGALRFTEVTMGVLAGAGFGEREAALAYRSLFTYTFASVLLASGPQAPAAAAAALAALPSDAYPVVAAHRDALAAAVADDATFAFGLERILDGLAAQRPAG